MRLLILFVLGVFTFLLPFKPSLADADRGFLKKVPSTRRGGKLLQTTGPNLFQVFTPEIRYWSDNILAWSKEFNLDPSIVATIMQIESCGDPTAVSPAGALGLFQVMPFHFSLNDDPLDPDTNARRGLAYFRDRLIQTGGNITQAFAGYNGGHTAADSTPDYWVAETRAYVHWASGIYSAASLGKETSQTLEHWLEAGGEKLCHSASANLGMLK